MIILILKYYMNIILKVEQQIILKDLNINIYSQKLKEINIYLIQKMKNM